MAVQEGGFAIPQLELSLGDYQLHGASIGHSAAGTTFACTIGPVPDEIDAALVRGAMRHETIRLLFPQPLLLDLIELERKEPQRVRIVGRIVDPVRAAESSRSDLSR